MSVSIHAPARGATAGYVNTVTELTGFNPRPRAGGDVYSVYQFDGILMFQSTPPRGGRPAAGRRGCTRPTVSIHAPARGATDGCIQGFNRVDGFNPRPRAGGDQSSPSRSGPPQCFNPRPRAGGDACLRAGVKPRFVSIHAPARGATMDPDPPGTPNSFQSTPPRGGRLHHRN